MMLTAPDARLGSAAVIPCTREITICPAAVRIVGRLAMKFCANVWIACIAPCAMRGRFTEMPCATPTNNCIPATSRDGTAARMLDAKLPTAVTALVIS